MGYGVRFSTLYVGQGQCNVIEVYGNTQADVTLPSVPALPNPPGQASSIPAAGYQPGGNIPNLLPNVPRGVTLYFLAVIDCGTVSAVNPHANYATLYIAQLAERRRVDEGLARPRIDYVNISHTDRDHHNLFSSIAHRFGAVQPEIGQLIMGGYDNAGDARNQVRDSFTGVQGRAGRFFVHHPHNLPSFRAPAGAPYPISAAPLMTCGVQLTNTDFLRLNTLQVNANYINALTGVLGAARHPGGDYRVNSASTVMLASLGQTRQGLPDLPILSVLFTGDATDQTFSSFLNLPMQQNAGPLPPPAPPAPQPPVPYHFNFGVEVKYVTIPHHGSYKSLMDTNRNIRDAPTYHMLEHFIRNTRPHIAAASARKYSRNWFHPAELVMNPFEVDMQHGNYPPMHIVPPGPAVHRNLVHNYDPVQHWRAKEYAENHHLYTTWYINMGAPLPAFDGMALIPNGVQRNLHLEYHWNPFALQMGISFQTNEFNI